MKRILYLLFLLSLPFVAFAQYPNAPNKIVLGRQTTGDGLIFRTSAKPTWTPVNASNAWLAIDTTTGNLWTYRGGEWFLEVAGDLRLVYPVVINKSGVDIKQGQVVMVDTVQLVQGDQVRVRPAIATVSNSQFIMGVASTDINNDSTGYVSWFGYVREVDHADIAQTGVTLDVGEILYISATEAGRYTDTEPAAPNVNATIALVVRKPSANNMTLLVRPWLNEKLGDLRDVDLSGLQTGDGIKWDGTKWVAGQFAGADSTVVSAGYGIDVSEVNNDFTVSADTSELSTKWFAADTASGVRDWVVAQGYTSNTGTVTSIATTDGITGGTITTTGTIGLTGQALALHNVGGSGFFTRGAGGTIALRGIDGGTGITVTDGNGLSGNPTITNSAPDQTVVLTAGTGISTSGTYPNFTITNSAPDQTVSIAAGTGISTSGSYPNFTITNSAPDQTVSITGAGINAVTGTYPNFTITGTEVDGSTTNELQNLSLSGQSLGITSGTGVTLPIIDVSAGSGISVTKASGNATVSAADASVSNEGTLGVGAGGANTAVITSNTSGANGVTISGGSNIAITESTSSNGGTVTIAATGLANSLNLQTGGLNSVYSGVPEQNQTLNFTDTLNFYFEGANFGIDTGTNKKTVLVEIATLYKTNGDLTNPRTVGTAGHKLTISGSNAAQVLEIDNTNTGTTTNALTLQSFGSPLQATRLTSVTGSIVPVSDYYVNTSGTAAAGLGGFHRFYIEDAGGLNKEAGRIGFRTSDATGSSYDSEAFISVRKDSSELKEGFTLLSTGQLQLKEYGDTTFTGTAVKYLAVDDDGKVIEVDGAVGTVKGTGAANKVAIWASADSLYQNTNLHWDNTNARLGINNTSPSERLQVGGNVRAERFVVNTFDTQSLTFSNAAATGASGWNLFINTGTGVLTSDASANVGLGIGSLGALTSGSTNLSLGAFAMRNTTSGGNNVGLGFQSLFYNTTGSRNFGLGTGSLLFNVTGSDNVAIGHTAGFVSTGNNNVFIGSTALQQGVGSNNTLIGTYAGYLHPTSGTISALDNSTLIGYDTRPSANSNTNEIVIGYEARGQGSNSAIIGNSSITNTYLRGKVSINTTANVNTLDVEGGAAIGATYSGTNTAPTNGLLVEGKTLIGTTTGDRPIPLQVLNNALIGGHLIGTSSESAGNFSNLIIGAKAYGDSIRTSLGASNTVIGYEAWGNADNDPGGENVVIGAGAALLTSANSSATDLIRSVIIGEDARASSSSATNQIVIGQAARGNGNNSTTIGNTSTTLTHLEGRVRTADYFDHRAPVTVTAATYTVGDATTYIIVNFAGTCNITLPTPASNTGRMLTIKTITANAVNSATGVNNVVPIDGDVAGNTILPATDGAWAQLVCDGTNWIIMQKG